MAVWLNPSERYACGKRYVKCVVSVWGWYLALGINRLFFQAYNFNIKNYHLL